MAIQNLLLRDETILETFEYRPTFQLGGFSIPSPVGTHNFYLTNKRVVKRTNNFGNEEIKDVNLGEIITIDYEKLKKRMLLYASVILFILTGIIPPILDLSLTQDSLMIIKAIAVLPMSLLSYIRYDNRTTVIVTVLALLSFLLVAAYAWFTEKNQFVIRTSNPEASIEVPASRDDGRKQRFIKEIRQRSQDYSKGNDNNEPL